MHTAYQQTNLEHCSLAVDMQEVGERLPRKGKITEVRYTGASGELNP